MKNTVCSDRLFATVSECGITILRTALEGMSSTEDVIMEIARRLKGVARGMVTVVVRNATQGWTAKVPVMLSDRRVNDSPRQLTLF